MGRPSKKTRANFAFYDSIATRFDFCGSAVPVLEDSHGVSAVQAFGEIDNRGLEVPCREPVALRRVLLAKASLNWHIKQWGECVADYLLALIELQEDFPELPDWVWVSVKKRAYKLGWGEAALLRAKRIALDK